MRRPYALFLALALVSPAPPLAAQQRDTTREARAPLFTTDDLYVAGGFALATLALAPLDKVFARELRDSTIQANRFFKDAATGVEAIARPGSAIIGGSLWAVGRLTGNRRMADLGLHGVEAIALSEVLTRGIKGLAGRARPAVNSNHPTDFDLGRGFGDKEHQSFPSGHTSAAFAAAAVVAHETAEWWPRWKWVIGPAMYGGAGLVGLSRMYNNRHWASDVAVGAAIGAFSGWKVVRYTHSNPDNPIDRLLLRAAIAPDGEGGTVVAWVIPLR